MNEIILEKKQQLSTQVEDELSYTARWFSDRQNSVNSNRNPGGRKPIEILLPSDDRIQVKIPIGFRPPGFRLKSTESPDDRCEASTTELAR